MLYFRNLMISVLAVVLTAACTGIEFIPVINPDGGVSLVPKDSSSVGQPSDTSSSPSVTPPPAVTPPLVRKGTPVFQIEVEGKGQIADKDNYVNINLVVIEGDEWTVNAPGRARGRGNATWGYPKKPYKIKFDEKQSLCGFPENKDWVLLAEYCDKSLMRTPYMCELARIAGVPYPINYRHVHLYINGNYNGMYLLTDSVEKKKNRVAIEDDGFLFENDNYFYEEPLSFSTSRKRYQYTFKYPDPEDKEISKGDESYEYIKGFMNEFETALYGRDFKDPDKGYRKYIDAESFARWFLVQELTANLEPNLYYVLPTRRAKLQIAPVWDAEWSLGLAYREHESAGWASRPKQPDSRQQIWSKWKYFGRLFEDPYFVDLVRDEWAELLLKLPDFRLKMAAVADNIKYEQNLNFGKWPILESYVSVGLVCMGNWPDEVQYVADFFEKRVEFLGEFLAEL